MSEKLARRFHEVYERLAPKYGYSTREETREFDAESPNGKLMIRVCGEVCGSLQAEVEQLCEENKRLQADKQRRWAEEMNELLRDENEQLRECIEWIAKNLPSCIAITKRTNGLYDCKIKEEVGDE